MSSLDSTITAQQRASMRSFRIAAQAIAHAGLPPVYLTRDGITVDVVSPEQAVALLTDEVATVASADIRLR